VEIYIYITFTDISSLDCTEPNGKNDLLGTVKDVQESSYNPTSDIRQNIYIPTPNKENQQIPNHNNQNKHTQNE
jgi:hypothetical protein